MTAYIRLSLFSRMLCLTAVVSFTLVTANALVICFEIDGHQAVELIHDGESHHECEDVPLQTIARLGQFVDVSSTFPVVVAFDITDQHCGDARPIAGLHLTSQPPPYHPHLHTIIFLI